MGQNLSTNYERKTVKYTLKDDEGNTVMEAGTPKQLTFCERICCYSRVRKNYHAIYNMPPRVDMQNKEEQRWEYICRKLGLIEYEGWQNYTSNSDRFTSRTMESLLTEPIRCKGIKTGYGGDAGRMLRSDAPVKDIATGMSGINYRNRLSYNDEPWEVDRIFIVNSPEYNEQKNQIREHILAKARRILDKEYNWQVTKEHEISSLQTMQRNWFPDDADLRYELRNFYIAAQKADSTPNKIDIKIETKTLKF